MGRKGDRGRRLRRGRARVVGHQPRREVDERRDGQGDQVEVVALDALDQRRAAALDRVAPGAALPLAEGQVPVDRLVVELAEGDASYLGGGAYAAAPDQPQAADDLVRAARQPPQRLARGG